MGRRSAFVYSLSECGYHVGETKVVSLEKQRLAEAFCERIGEAIAKIEARWVTAFAIDLEAAFGEFRLGFIEWNNLEPDPLKKSTSPHITFGSISAHENDRAFEGCACGHIPRVGLHDDAKQLLSV
jgi:hypothetical protein